jgi:hypothetical protein
MREWRNSSPVPDPGSRWRRKLSFTLRLLYPNPWHQLDKRLSEPQSQCGRVGEETSLLSLPGIEPWLSNQSPVAIPIKIISAAMNTIMNTAVLHWHKARSNSNGKSYKTDLDHLTCSERAAACTEKLNYTE